MTGTTLAQLEAKVEHLAHLIATHLGIDVQTPSEAEQAEKDAAAAEKAQAKKDAKDEA